MFLDLVFNPSTYFNTINPPIDGPLFPMSVKFLNLYLNLLSSINSYDPKSSFVACPPSCWIVDNIDLETSPL